MQDDFDESALFKAPPKAPASNNPLSRYFRVPGVHITLPTRGAFMPPEDYDPTLAGDIPVYPMKASDELILKSPDALMSGLAVEELITSCVPSIRNPREISTPDLDAILLAIRAATYGDKMEMEVVCPKCGHDNLFDCHLPAIMSTMTFIDEKNEVRLSDEVVAYVRPYRFAMATKIALATFEEGRKMQALETDEERQEAMKGSYKRLSGLNTEAVADSIVSITVPEGEVSDPKFVLDFVNNISRTWVKLIEDKLTEINNKGVDKSLAVQCVKCDHEWSTSVEFDPSSFFDSGS